MLNTTWQELKMRLKGLDVIVDRFEGDFAVCEKPDLSMINIHKSRLPEGVKEGDSLKIFGADDIRLGERRQVDFGDFFK